MTFSIDDLCAIVGYRLSEEQLEVVTADLNRPLQVIAGAGSGKTSVMAARVVWAVAQGLARRDEVLGLTFTSKASAELSSRLRRWLSRLESDVEEDAADPIVATYHSFARQLINEYGLRSGIEPALRLLSDADANYLALQVAERTELHLSGMGVSPAGLAPAVVALDGQLAEHAVDIDALQDFDARFIERADALTKSVVRDRSARSVSRQRQQLCALVKEFRAEKLSRGVVDFSDLMRFGLATSENPEVRLLARDRWKLVLLDEYQDTSVVQARMLAGLFADHAVTAVGDPMQAIYGWRGASASAMDEFAQLFAVQSSARRCELSISHRSGPRVLSAANAVAAPLRNELTSVVTLRSGNSDEVRRGNVTAALFETYDDEVDFVAAAVANQIAAGVPASSIAVICRLNKDFAQISDALSRRGVVSQVAAVEGLLAQPEIVDLVSMLELAHDPAANPAALRLLLGPRWRIGPRDLAMLGRRAAALGKPGRKVGRAADLAGALDEAVAGTDRADVLSLIDAVADPGSPSDFAYSDAARERFSAITETIAKLRAHIREPLPDLIAQVISLSGLDVEISLRQRRAEFDRLPTASALGSAALAAFQALVDGFVANADTASLGAFLGWLSSIDQLGTSPSFELPTAADAVQLLTVHRAKGLEWDVVVVPFLSDGVFPTARPRSRWTSSMSQLPHWLRGDRDALPDLRGFGTKAHDEFADELKAFQQAEERRLAYVAITRAANMLIASGHWWGPDQKTPRGPSPYLLDIRDAAESFDGDLWVAESAYVENPALSQPQRFAWPPTADTDLQERRHRAADLVYTAMEKTSVVDLSDAEAHLVSQWDADIDVLLAERDQRPRTAHSETQSISTTELVQLSGSVDDVAIDRIARPEPREPSTLARRGTRFHSWIEDLFGQRRLFDDLPGEHDEQLLSVDELESLQAGFLRTPYANRTPHAVEVPFSIVLGGRVVTGRIDAVYRDGDHWQVVDWKTGDGMADPLQLAIYRCAWAQIQGIPAKSVRAAFVYAKSGTVVEHDDLPGLAELAAIVTAANRRLQRSDH